MSSIFTACVKLVAWLVLIFFRMLDAMSLKEIYLGYVFLAMATGFLLRRFGSALSLGSDTADNLAAKHEAWYNRPRRLGYNKRGSMENEMLTIDEVANFLRISLPTAYRLARNNIIPCLKVGARYIVPRDDFMEWVRTGTVGGTSHG